MHINRTALVTGGAQGIGKAIARSFLDKGYGVAALDQDQEALEELGAEFESTERFLGVAGDVSNEQSVREAVQQTIERFGRLNVLVNNAGVGQSKPIVELSLEEWNRILGVNLTGAFLCTKHALSYLRQTGGSIVNIASTRALMSEPHTEAYSASKGGIVALTHALAVSCGPEVTVNCISPGWIEVSAWKKAARRSEPKLTPEDHSQHPCGRVGKPEDVAQAALFLADPENSFVTGVNMVLDGGMTRKMMYVE